MTIPFKKDSKTKPYYAIGKAFLKERDCNGEDSPNELAKYIDIEGNEKYLKLKPGEFYIKTTIPLNAAYVKLKIKNSSVLDYGCCGSIDCARGSERGYGSVGPASG